MIYSALTSFPHLLSADVTPSTAPTRLSFTPLPTRLSTVEFENWDCLLVALSSRLRSTVDRSADDKTVQPMSAHARGDILECADDLDLLHAALNAERSEFAARAYDGEHANHNALKQAVAEFNTSLKGQKNATRGQENRRPASIYKAFN